MTGAPAVFYGSLLAFYLPFVVIPAAIGAIVAILAVRLFARLRRGPWVAGGAGGRRPLRLLPRQARRPEPRRHARRCRRSSTSWARTQSPFLPSYWAAQGVLGAATGDVREAGFYFLLLLANALLFTWIATAGRRALLLPRLVGARGRRTAGAPPAAGSSPASTCCCGPCRSRPGRWWSKDLRLFWRDPAQWSQFVLFFGIMALYVANLRGTRSFPDEESWRTWGTLLNLGASMLILASLTTRFIYPLISLEGRRFWILGLSPVTLRRVVWQKFWLSRRHHLGVHRRPGAALGAAAGARPR